MQQTGPAVNRRRHERFVLPPMYSRLRVRRLDDADFRYAGHIYDVSEGGVRFELDDPIEPGTPVAVEIALPGLGDPDNGDIGPGRSVFAVGNVIWVNEEDLPGPVRMAVAFTRYARTGDHERLIGHLGHSGYARAA